MKKTKTITLFLLSVFLFIAITNPLIANAANITLNTSELSLCVGSSATLKINGTKSKIQWSSSKKSVATVTTKGKVTGKKKGTATITARLGKKKYICKVMVYQPSSGNKQIDTKIKSIIKKNISVNMTTAEKVKVIHDYLALNCAYDYNNYLKGTLPAVSYSPQGVLMKKKAVCQGYADTFQLFMDALNIPCKTVTGTANGGGHAWNMVKINGKWFQIDVTWDDPVPDKKGYVRYSYFLITDTQMSKTHNWNKSAYPKCTTSSNRFIKNLGTVSKNTEQAVQNFVKGYQTNKSNIQLIVPKKLGENNEFLSNLIFKDLRKIYPSYAINSFQYSYYIYGDYYIYTIKCQ